MHDRTADTRSDHERAGRRGGFASRTGFGARPAPLVIEFIDGIAEPGANLGKGLSQERGRLVR